MSIVARRAACACRRAEGERQRTASAVGVGGGCAWACGRKCCPAKGTNLRSKTSTRAFGFCRFLKVLVPLSVEIKKNQFSLIATNKRLRFRYGKLDNFTNFTTVIWEQVCAIGGIFRLQLILLQVCGCKCGRMEWIFMRPMHMCPMRWWRCRLAATLVLAMMQVTVTHRSSADMHGHIVVDAGPRGTPATSARPGAAFAPSSGAGLPCLRHPGTGPAAARTWCAGGVGLHRPVRSLVDDDVGARRRTHAHAGSRGGLYMLARNGASPADDARRKSSAGAEDSRLTGIGPRGSADAFAGPVSE